MEFSDRILKMLWNYLTFAFGQEFRGKFYITRLELMVLTYDWQAEEEYKSSKNTHAFVAVLFALKNAIMAKEIVKHI